MSFDGSKVAISFPKRELLELDPGLLELVAGREKVSVGWVLVVGLVAGGV